MSTEDKLRRADVIPLEDLALYWQGRATVLRMVDAAAKKSNEATLEAANAYEECVVEIREALAATQEQRGELKGFNRMSNARMEVKVRDYKDRLATEIGSAIEARILTGSEDIFGIGREVVDGKFVSSLIESALRSAPSAHTSSKSDAQMKKPK